MGVAGPLGPVRPAWGRGRFPGPIQSPWGRGRSPGPCVAAVGAWPVAGAPYGRRGVAGFLGPV